MYYKQYNLDGNWIELDKVSRIGKIDQDYKWFDYLIEGREYNVKGTEIEKIHSDFIEAWKK